MTCALIVSLGAALLSGCSAGPNSEAVEATSSFSKKLSDWSAELSTAVETARTATQAEWVTGEGELGFEEVGLGEVLESAPELDTFDPSEVENTPTYNSALRAAEHVDAIVEELAELEPKALETLRQASDDSYWVIADLYYDTLSGPATDRLTAQGEALEHTDDFPTFYKILRTSSLSFAQERMDLLGVAVEEMGGPVDGEDRPLIPETGLGVSVGAFIVEWFQEEVAFQQDMVEEIGSWKTLGGHGDSFSNFGNVNGAFNAPAEYAAVLRPAFAAQIGEVAAALSKSTDSSGDSNESLKLPALGDPYRQALLDGYLPWGDTAESQAYTANRLWLLWHIRELEDTPDAAYSAARSALLEEFNRSIEEDAGVDFRPGSGRVLALIKANTLSLLFTSDVESNTQALAAVEELLGYGELLSTYPMTSELSAAFDEVLKLNTELAAQAAATIEDIPDEYDQWRALSDLQQTYEDDVFDAASTALDALDDDAQAEALTAAAIEGTAPGAAAAK